MRLLRKLCLMLVVFSLSSSLLAASAQEINAKVNQALKEFYQHSPAGKELTRKAAGGVGIS